MLSLEGVEKAQNALLEPVLLERLEPVAKTSGIGLALAKAGAAKKQKCGGVSPPRRN